MARHKRTGRNYPQDHRSAEKHPALLAWYINDEQPSSQIERLTAMRRLFNQMDANHPTYGVLYQYEDLPMYGSTSDIIGVDPYPLNGDNLKKAVYAMTQSRLAGLPAWVVPQAANISIYSSEKKLENPQNPSEEKCGRWFFSKPHTEPGASSSTNMRI